MNRRKFLQAAGLGGASFFLPSLLRSPLARASTGSTPPTRLVIVFGELGPEIKSFRMKPPGTPDSLLAGSNYHPDTHQVPDEQCWEIFLNGLSEEQFSPVLRPLYDFRDRMIALDGLCLATAAVDNYGDDHAKGWTAVSTGYPSGYGHTSQRSHAARPSVDQLIKRYLRQQDANLTDLTSLEMRVSKWYTNATSNGFHYWIFDEDMHGVIQRVPVEQDPRALFDRLFPQLPSGDDPAMTAQQDVLNYLTERYAVVRPRLSQQDRQKLDRHRQLVSDLQNRLRLQTDLSCTPPERMQRDHSQPSDAIYGQNLDSFIDLITASLSCGLTRVATLQLGTFPPYEYLRDGDFDFPDHDEHDFYSHRSDPSYEFHTDSRRDDWLIAHVGQMRKTRYNIDVVRRIAAALDAVPEETGTLLDNTIILWVDEISHGGHGHDQFPAVIVGGTQHFRTGRYIRFPRNNPTPRPYSWGNQFVGQPYNPLLVSICQTMGMPIDDLGIRSVDGQVKSGNYQGLRKTLNLAGTLAELY